MSLAVPLDELSFLYGAGDTVRPESTDNLLDLWRSSFAVGGVVEFSHGYLDQLERRHARLMSDLAIVEGRLDEVSGMLREER